MHLFELDEVGSRFIECQFTLTVSMASLKVKVMGQSSATAGIQMFGSCIEADCC